MGDRRLKTALHCIIQLRLSLSVILGIRVFLLLASIWDFHTMLLDPMLLQGSPGVKGPGGWAPVPSSARAVLLL